MNPTPPTDQYKELHKLLKELAVDFMGENSLVKNQWIIDETKEAILALIQDEVRKARIEEIQNITLWLNDTAIIEYVNIEYVKPRLIELRGLSEGKE